MRCFINGESSTVFVVLALCGFLLPLVQRGQSAAESVSTNGNEISPFLLLGVGHRLYSLPYTWPDTPQGGNEVLLHSGSSFFYYITGISYHYRKRLIFWCTNGGVIYQGSFQDHTKLTDITSRQVITGGSPFEDKFVGDLAVDWLNDKLYWTDRDGGKIEELDLETNERKVVLQSEVPAVFNGLAMFPYPDYGWLYWTDNMAGKIERVAVTGERRQLVQSELASCVLPVEIDYSEQNVYWANTCERSLKSLHIGESDQSVNRVQINTEFNRLHSMTLFGDTLYWNEGGTVKATNKSISLGEVVQIYKVGASQSVVSIAVEVVHAKKQPGVDEFLDIISENIGEDLLNETCPPCINGKCLPPGGNCTCFTGWTGDNCTTDFDECALETSGCEQECHNTPGSFYCSCNAGFYLDSDAKTCILAPTTYVIEPSISSSGVGLEETLAGSFYTTVPLVTSAAATSFQPVSTPIPTSSHFTVISSSPVAYTTISASPVPISSSYATQVQLAASRVITEPQESSMAKPRTTEFGSTTDSLPEPSQDNMMLIIIVAAAGGSCAILVVVVIIMIIVVVRYAHNRCGSYTVNPDPSKESGAPSWITVNSVSPVVQHTANGHSHLVKSTFRAHSPTCSTNSFS